MLDILRSTNLSDQLLYNCLRQRSTTTFFVNVNSVLMASQWQHRA